LPADGEILNIYLEVLFSVVFVFSIVCLQFSMAAKPVLAADCSLLTADVGQKNLLSIFQSTIVCYLSHPSRVLRHMQDVLPLGKDA
jgi:hypothetical protein